MARIGQERPTIEALAARIRAAAPSPSLRDAFATLRLEEVVGSSALAGAELDLAETRALLERGRAVGGRRLADYLLVRGYAEAAGWAAQRAGRTGRVTTEDIRTLHRLALAGANADAGAWRTRTVPPLADGTVPPPHWLVPFETETYVGRLALDEERAAPVALAHAVGRLVRLQPFPSGNGRVARLVANLLAYRRGLPPLVLDARARRAYRNALAQTLAGNAQPLALVFGSALRRGLDRLLDAVDPAEELRPLAAFAAGASAARLYKAAQRGRLRVVRREGRLFTTAPWVASYAGTTAHPPPTLVD